MARLDPDTQIRIELIGTTERLFYAKVDQDEAIAEVQRIAGGRADLLAGAAGHFLGSDTWCSLVCHRLLMATGADPELVEAAAERTRRNLQNSGHTTAGTRAPN